MRILTKNNCPACVRVKDFLTRKEIDFEECNTDDSEKYWCEWYEITKEKGVPRTVPVMIQGDKKIVGSTLIMNHIDVEAVEANVVEGDSCDSCQ